MEAVILMAPQLQGHVKFKQELSKQITARKSKHNH